MASSTVFYYSGFCLFLLETISSLQIEQMEAGT